ncbi:hypothetical protein CSE_12810 [Caldisericum exile AZM16c01]|uniref:Uncharacterized protein n=1 Tax=Caldisericum exile (strain DSM 21853 / NBRC 104410 / AZM16c01) TaxID=511051 RepID=A0A7U6GFE2_CALEA|nr:hypothetical protein CSE_12810 [Caldisericum exile AZM16c01]
MEQNARNLYLNNGGERNEKDIGSFFGDVYAFHEYV